ncbi:type 1 glutamine amidotransferase domain-containing protein [Gilvimarinus agarilyticus]|uniref:type 1 glutamine amidotransferase domain-containing protein n=1 Tax=unclassified Gilvimarinus TaxID=2642066 RepID=UPI001C0909C8|nr:MULTISPECIES: type 1 glutamine amidotransferase domain-containing protein [unclassified Gilvimarinus]MBU2887291.1 type 1 glutamine amidotransferase domain-containing protein [Gilvimarinus agarilyticus]MDO6571950.1 type 1 glutamine amidotransferase domain-containing protein [Gilvimarinus sp. 2_MG-2023]MDO6746019.1 type 1 glutamine amidotransferase domain-containing protein [Gilvimarinus sp. 1_MG-2023]
MTEVSAKRVLMVLTSHDKLGNSGEKTGFWIEEFAAPYYALADAGVQVTLASPAGGQPPVDPKSELEDFQTTSTRRFDADKHAQALVANTTKLADVNAENYDGVFYPGGHGPLWDLTDNGDSIALIENFLATNKPVAAVCHAPAVFLNVKDANGEYAVKGKAVTGFTNAEEAAVQLTDVVPFLLEDELKKRGAEFQKVADWHAFAVKDGLLISGQNPQSSELAAEKLLAALTS